MVTGSVNSKVIGSRVPIAEVRGPSIISSERLMYSTLFCGMVSVSNSKEQIIEMMVIIKIITDSTEVVTNARSEAPNTFQNVNSFFSSLIL